MKEVSKTQLQEFLKDKGVDTAKAVTGEVVKEGFDLKKSNGIITEVNQLFSNINGLLNNDFVQKMISNGAERKSATVTHTQPQTQVVEPKLASELAQEKPQVPTEKQVQEVPQPTQELEKAKKDKAVHLYNTILSLLEMQIKMNEQATVKELFEELKNNQQSVCVQLEMIL